MATAKKAEEVKRLTFNEAQLKKKFKITFSMQAQLRKAHVLPSAKDSKTGRIEYTFTNQAALDKTLAAIKEWRAPKKEAPETTVQRTAPRTHTAA